MTVQENYPYQGTTANPTALMVVENGSVAISWILQGTATSTGFPYICQAVDCFQIETSSTSLSATEKTYSIEMLSSQDAAVGALVAAESFLNEPLVFSQKGTLGDAMWFMEGYVASVAGNGLSYIAIRYQGGRRRKEEEGTEGIYRRPRRFVCDDLIRGLRRLQKSSRNSTMPRIARCHEIACELLCMSVPRHTRKQLSKAMTSLFFLSEGRRTTQEGTHNSLLKTILNRLKD